MVLLTLKRWGFEWRAPRAFDCASPLGRVLNFSHRPPGGCSALAGAPAGLARATRIPGRLIGLIFGFAEFRCADDPACPHEQRSASQRAGALFFAAGRCLMALQVVNSPVQKA